MTGRESFPRLLLAEWTKLRSVSRWVITLLGAALVTIGLSYVAASGNKTDVNSKSPTFVTGPLGEPVDDTFYFVHQRVTGDVTLTARVASFTPQKPAPAAGPDKEFERLRDGSPFAQPAAGIMVKDGTQTGSSYASLLLTPGQGVRLQWDFDGDRVGSSATGSRWLRLVRAGGTVTGYESADGERWSKVGVATPENLPSTVEIGFYVSSPDALYTSRGGGTSSVSMRPTRAKATFDNVHIGSRGEWRGERVGVPLPRASADDPGDGARPRGRDTSDKAILEGGGSVTESGGVYAVSGTGKVGPHPPDADLVESALLGVIAGIMALIAVGVLFATSEYRRGMIRTTFAATPRRGRVLAAKALVLGGVSYVVALLGTVGSFLVAIPVLRRHGYTLPAYPEPSITDGPVLRALLLSAAFMAGVAVVAMGIGIVLRHSAAAITITIVAVLLPVIVGMILPGSSPKWLMYGTLAGGLATQRAQPPTITLVEPWALIGPWAGIGAVAAWVVVVLGFAWWSLRRRDV